MKTVFVTGTTGFLGSHFLVNFVGREIEHAFVLIRGNNADERRQKLVSALRKACQSYLAVPDINAILDRVTIIKGDISVSGFGVDAADITRLRGENIVEFWHFAASLNFEDYRREHIHSTNVDGAMNAIRFCADAGIGRFVYISTAYTCGAVNGEVREELHSLDRPFSNFYEESKCNAEHLITAECRKSGLAMTTFRPSVVIGNSQTRRPGGSDSGLYGFIREISRLKKALAGSAETTRIFGMPDGQVNFIPVDLLMENIRTVVQRGMVDGGIHHLAFDRNPRTKRCIEMICDQLEVTNLVMAHRDGSALSSLESLIEKKTVFYSSYIGSSKRFERSITGTQDMTEEELLGYIIEGINALDGDDVDSTFERHRLQASDGVTLNVLRTGSKDAQAVLICNAVGMPAEFVRPLAAALAPTCQVITWESRTLPSPAASERDADVGLARHAADALDILEMAGVREAVVIGWCTGARLALHLASHYPGHVTGVALLNGGYNLPGCEKTLFEKNMSLVMPKMAKDPKYAALFHKAIFSRRSEETHRDEADAQTASSNLLSSTAPEFVHLTSIPFHSVDNLARYARLVSAFLGEPPTALEFEIRKPVLVLTGEDDITTSSLSSRLIADAIPGARFAILPGADHFALYANLDFQRAVLDFVAALPVRVGAGAEQEVEHEAQ